MKEGVCIKGKHLILNVVFPYYIELSEINTPKKVKWWIEHLSTKNWVTPGILSKMVNLLEKHFDYDLHNFLLAG